jgi:hypothetical protein
MDTIAQYRFAQEIPWRLPLGLIITFLIALTALAWSPGQSVDNGPPVNATLAVLSAACAMESGQLDYAYDRNETARCIPTIPRVQSREDEPA